MSPALDLRLHRGDGRLQSSDLSLLLGHSRLGTVGLLCELQFVLVEGLQNRL